MMGEVLLRQPSIAYDLPYGDSTAVFLVSESSSGSGFVGG